MCIAIEFKYDLNCVFSEARELRLWPTEKYVFFYLEHEIFKTIESFASHLFEFTSYIERHINVFLCLKKLKVVVQSFTVILI